MKTAATTSSNSSAMKALRANPDWAKLLLFDRKGWKRLPFGEFAENIRESVMPTPSDSATYIGLEHMDSGSLHVHRWGSHADLKGQKLRMRKGDILFARRNAYLRRVAIAPHDGLFSAHGLILRAKNTLVLPEFLPFLIMSNNFMSRAEKISVGSLSPTINWTTLKHEEFALPPPAQQRLIAEVLWAVDSELQGQQQVQLSLGQTKEAINDEYFLSNLTFADIRRLGKSGHGNFKKLKQVTRRITDGVHLTPKFSNTGVAFLLVSNLASGVIDWNIERWIPRETFEELTRNKRVERGDVLYTVVASFGIPVFVDWDREFCFQRHIALIKPDPKQLLGKYLTHFLQSRLGKKQAQIYAEGNAQRTITLGSLSDFVLPVPEIEEQRELVDRLEKIDGVITAARDLEINTRAIFFQLINGWEH